MLVVSLASVAVGCGSDDGAKKADRAPQSESQKKDEKSFDQAAAPGFTFSKSKKFQMKIHWMDTPAKGKNTAHVEFLNANRSVPDSITNVSVTAYMTGHGNMGKIPVKVSGHNNEASHKTISNIELTMTGNYTLSFNAIVAGVPDSVDIDVVASSVEDHSGHKH